MYVGNQACRSPAHGSAGNKLKGVPSPMLALLLILLALPAGYVTIVLAWGFFARPSPPPSTPSLLGAKDHETSTIYLSWIALFAVALFLIYIACFGIHSARKVGYNISMWSGWRKEGLCDFIPEEGTPLPLVNACAGTFRVERIRSDGPCILFSLPSFFTLLQGFYQPSPSLLLGGSPGHYASRAGDHIRVRFLRYIQE